jgi:hypothetical protein
VDGDAAFELAKDVAAFANAAGGSLLHCAHEDKKRRALGRYSPVTQAETAGIVNAYDFAIRDRCFPGISWSDARIALDHGFVAAINVQPFPGQIVGVKVKGDKADGHGGDAYVFPVRVGTHTRCLTPGELAMYMVPEVRMTIVALEAIPDQERANVTLIQLLGGNANRHVKDGLAIVAIEPERNALRFDNNESYPLNCVRAVWHNGRHWCISVEGTDLG